MLSNEVREWLVEYKGLSDAEINTFASTLAINDKLVEDIFVLFETLPYSAEELDPVCHQLYEFYRSKEEKLKVFSLQFAATLICLYLRCLGNSDKKVCGGVETFLLGVYNLEIVLSDGSPVVESFCIPSISKASIYHESRIPGVSEPLTEHALRSLNPSQSLWNWGPFSQHENFNAQNRFSILSFIMQRYNMHIDSFHKVSLDALCKAAITLGSTGFNNNQDSTKTFQPRLAVSSSLLIEYMVAVYFAMFHGHHPTAIRAVEVTHQLASFELYSDVLLITSSIINSIRQGHLKFEALDVSITAPKYQYTFKNTITNASFKAKKLPDDIDFVEEEESSRLPTVEEDQEQSVTKILKARLLTIGGKLSGDKNKNRDNIRRDSDTPSLKSGSGVEIAESVGVGIRNPGGGGGKVVIDVLELQPLKGRGNEDSSDGGSSRNSYTEKGGEGKQMKASSSPVVYSKKSGVMQQGSQSSSGLASMYSDSPPKALFAYSTSASVSSNAINGKASSGSSSINSSISSVRAPTQHHKSNLSPHSPRAQSEGPSRDGPKLTSSKLPPSSTPSLLSTLSQPFPNNQDSSPHSNLSEPTLTHHSSSGSQPPSPSSTHSIPSVAVIASSSKSLINQTTCSTNL